MGSKLADWRTLMHVLHFMPLFRLSNRMAAKKTNDVAVQQKQDVTLSHFSYPALSILWYGGAEPPSSSLHPSFAHMKPTHKQPMHHCWPDSYQARGKWQSATFRIMHCMRPRFSRFIVYPKIEHRGSIKRGFISRAGIHALHRMRAFCKTLHGKYRIKLGLRGLAGIAIAVTRKSKLPFVPKPLSN